MGKISSHTQITLKIRFAEMCDLPGISDLYRRVDGPRALSGLPEGAWGLWRQMMSDPQCRLRYVLAQVETFRISEAVLSKLDPANISENAAKAISILNRQRIIGEAVFQRIVEALVGEDEFQPLWEFLLEGAKEDDGYFIAECCCVLEDKGDGCGEILSFYMDPLYSGLRVEETIFDYVLAEARKKDTKGIRISDRNLQSALRRLGRLSSRGQVAKTTAS